MLAYNISSFFLSILFTIIELLLVYLVYLLLERHASENSKFNIKAAIKRIISTPYNVINGSLLYFIFALVWCCILDIFIVNCNYLPDKCQKFFNTGFPLCISIILLGYIIRFSYWICTLIFNAKNHLNLTEFQNIPETSLYIIALISISVPIFTIYGIDGCYLILQNITIILGKYFWFNTKNVCQDLIDKLHKHFLFVAIPSIKIIEIEIVDFYFPKISTSYLVGSIVSLVVFLFFNANYALKRQEKPYNEIVRLISLSDEEVVKEAIKCNDNINEYKEIHKEVFSDLESPQRNDDSLLKWIGCIELLINNGYAFKINFTTPKNSSISSDDFINKLRSLRSIKQYELLIDDEWVNDVHLWWYCAKLINIYWDSAGYTIAMINIINDTYAIVIQPKSAEKTLIKLSESENRKINFFCDS